MTKKKRHYFRLPNNNWQCNHCGFIFTTESATTIRWNTQCKDNPMGSWYLENIRKGIMTKKLIDQTQHRL